MKLLFVCVENSCRSQIAEALARLRGAEAFSAGSLPSGVVNPGAITALAELGYDMGTHTSKSVDEFAAQTFDVVVTMGCGDACPHISAQTYVDWEIPDPKHMDAEGFRRVRDTIAKKIDELL